MEALPLTCQKTSAGINPKDEGGNKKVPLALLPSAGIIHGARAMKNGADKYGPYNYRDKHILVMIYLDAIMRHLLSYLDGEECDEDSGVHHLGHIIANASIILDSRELGTIVDNRPTRGKASELLSLK